MPFSKDVKENALVLAARRCAVCHRYKGVKVEVHHIIQEADGGHNDFENAIVLCYDCHSDAGHYNSKHPRGTKFSPQELRKHRERWYEVVRNNKIEGNETDDSFYCRYLVCKHFDIIREICNSNLEHLPGRNSFLVQNEVLSFQKKIIASHPNDYRHSQIYGDCYQSRDEYLEKNSNAKIVSKPARSFSTVAHRFPTEPEFQKRIAEHDGISRVLSALGEELSDITKAIVHEDPCGGCPLQEVYLLKPLWGVYLEVSNISDRYIKPEGIIGCIEKEIAFKSRPFVKPPEANSKLFPLPEAPIPPNSTIIIPLATILAPLENRAYTELSSKSVDIEFAHWQEETHATFEEDLIENVRLFGPSIWPEGLQFNKNGSNICQGIHEFNLKNLYVIDRHWAMGSCPHLFFIRNNTQQIEYLGEILGGVPNKTCVTNFITPSSSGKLIIAELEYEETYLQEISVDNEMLARDITLSRGEYYEIETGSFQNVTIKGHYVLIAGAFKSSSAFNYKKDLIGQFIYNLSLTTGLTRR